MFKKTLYLTITDKGLQIINHDRYMMTRDIYHMFCGDYERITMHKPNGHICNIIFDEEVIMKLVVQCHWKIIIEEIGE